MRKRERPVPGNSRRRRLQTRNLFIICIGLVTITWLVFGQTLRHGFINYDDPAYVYGNTHITHGLTAAGVVWAFTHIHADNWHPLTTLSHMLDCELFGLNASGHHFTNVLLHTIAVLLLFALLRETTGKMWPSAFVAIVFAIHPLRVESVAWVAERKDVLSGVFFMLTLILYVRYVRNPSPRRYAVMSIIFACGLMSKPMLVTTPVILLLLDYWPLDRRSSMARLLIEKIPLAALSLCSSVATSLAQQQSVGTTAQLPLSLRIGNALVSYVVYVAQMIWPVHLAPFYPHPEGGIPFWWIAASAVLLLGITGIALLLRQRQPYLLTGWLWFVLMLAPVIGIIQVGWQARADRYTYLTQIGLYLAVTWLVIDLLKSVPYKRAILAASAVGLVSVLGWRASVQASYWKNNETLWTHTLAVTRNNDVAENNLGTVFFQRGLIDEALARFELATRLRPGNASAQDNLARTLRRKGRIAEAISHAQRALVLQPDKIETRDMLGTMLFEQGDVEAALAEWREVVARGPDSYALNNLAWVLSTYPDSAVRHGTEAVKFAKKALDLSGDNSAGLRTLAAAYAESGRFSDAIKAGERAEKLATSENDLRLFDQLQKEIVLYREEVPLRAGRADGESAP